MLDPIVVTMGVVPVARERAVEKHVRNIFQKLSLPPADTNNRRVLAVLRFLEAL